MRSQDPGGARRSRTDDILLAKQALYQLSYGPVPENGFTSPAELSVRSQAKPALKQRTTAWFALAPPARMLVGPGRLELPTLRLSGVRSNQAELRAFGGTTARQIPRLAIARFYAPARMAGASKREIGMRNGDGGAPQFIGASIATLVRGPLETHP